MKMSLIDNAKTILCNPRNYTANTGTNRIKYIVIHYVGATGSAKANCNYYASTYVGASAHDYVDFNGDIYHSVPYNCTAWHCGTRNGYKHPECRNSNSIGIEMCVRNKGSKADTSKDWYFEDATYEATIALTKELMKKFGVTPDRVIRHHDVTGKICGNPFVYNHTKHTWENFKAAIEQNDVVKKEAGWRIAADGVRYWYERANGTYPAKQWCIINHHWYLFDEDGYMLTGWQKWDSATQSRELGKWYFLDNTRGGDLEGACWHEVDEEDGGWEIWYVPDGDTV